MKKIVLLSVIVALFAFKMLNEPWTKEQILQPETLAATMQNAKAKQPIIINIGPAGSIKTSVSFGSTQDKESLDSLQHFLQKIPKNTEVVLYCGCCPFEHCPNIRPAFTLIKQMKFTNPKLLNLSHNLKVDWIDKGFPMSE